MAPAGCLAMAMMTAGGAFAQALVPVPALISSASSSSASSASSAASDTDAQAGGKRGVCVDVEVDGVRALSYDCLSRQLQSGAAPSAGASQPASEDRARQPSNRIGTFNLSAERNRFGANWGKSVTPQRPALPVAVPPR
ncbi:hypothetical protein [Burkholderia sp. A1]|uniref:hypothetical protein n=1 Tax=Burkholderia sp. A1 TaxID=148446 RepID=UPI001F58629B|nr:hypothetical protein [Burkholderia sp. A1]